MSTNKETFLNCRVKLETLERDQLIESVTEFDSLTHLQILEALANHSRLW